MSSRPKPGVAERSGGTCIFVLRCHPERSDHRARSREPALSVPKGPLPFESLSWIVIPSITTPGLSRHTLPRTSCAPLCLPSVFAFVRSTCGPLIRLESRDGTRWFHQPSIRHLLPRFSSSVSLTPAGRRAAHSSARFGYRFPQDDPGLPACRTSSAYVHSLRSIQYNLIANRRATITLATARLPLRTHSRW